jgi:predicted nucleotide-binding protein
MLQKTDIRKRVLTKLISLKPQLEKLKGLIGERYVQEYHEELNKLEDLGDDISDFRINSSDIHPRVTSVTMSGERSYSDEKYVDSILMMTRLDCLIKTIEDQMNVNEVTIPGKLNQITNDVFIVHGTDHGVKETVARLLSKLKLNPIILHEQVNMAATIIEKLEKNSNVSFCVVLLTPDDKGGIVGGEQKFRARQNVIFELGYFMSKLSRAKVCALHDQRVELPSDYQGILYIPLDSGGAWQLTLAKEIKAAGLLVDLNLLL